ncbi:MAG: DUF1512 family protein, partial [Candidatus Aenigmatarchaeota archaeon]
MIGMSDPWMIINIILLFVLIFFGPRLMLYQTISVLEAKARSYDEMSKNSRKVITKKLEGGAKLSKKDLTASMDRIMEYFIIEPDTTEPTGLAKKVRELTIRHDKKLDLFLEDISPGLSENERRNLAGALISNIGIYQITKTIRHFIEMIKESKNFQIGMILQMQLPMIDKQVKALYASVPAFSGAIPVGDCIGPLYAANLIGTAKTSEITEGTVVAQKRIEGKEVFILKAKGPGANLGQIDEAIRKISSKNTIEKVITIDASGKLEGEKTGTVAEGIGFAMGP